MNKEIIKQAIIDQKEELGKDYRESNIIEREFYKEYQKYLGSMQVKVVTGIRRCGKSVLAYQLLKEKNFAYVNFDDEKLAGITTEELNDILEILYEVYGNFEYVLFDEIQNIDKWELFVNRLQRQKLNITITGSNSNLLSRELATHLTGRHILLELFPFSFIELLRFKNISFNINLMSTKEKGVIKKELSEYIHLGGFPDVCKRPQEQKKYLQSLYSNIINIDVISRHKIRNGAVLKSISNSLMSDSASLISYNKIKNFFNLKSIHTAQDYISYLEEVYLFFLLPKFSFKPKEREVANRKLYLIDTGLIGSVGTNFSLNLGKIYENIVFLHLARRKILFDMELFYWQDVYNNEVDFIVKEGLKIKQLIQVCYDINDYGTKKREISSLIKASKELKCDKLFVITNDFEKEELIEKKKIKFIPLWKWLLLEFKD